MRGLFISLILIATLNSFAQKHTIFRAYNQSAIITIQNNSSEKLLYTPYGKIISKSSDIRYSYQAQEFDKALGLHIFPSRLYSNLSKRFLQPDPKSQYFSAYLFVGSDPINNIDIDGNVSRPLVLYQQDHTQPGSMPLDMQDLKAAYPDAYYVPLSDLSNETVGDLSEWDGTVFIRSNAMPFKDADFEVERSINPHKLVSKNTLEGCFTENQTHYFNRRIGAYKLGNRLRDLSNKYRPVSEVMFSNSVSGDAMHSFGDGFAAQSQNISMFDMRHRINAYSLKEGYISGVAGERVAASNGLRYEYEGPKFFAGKNSLGIFLGSYEHEGKNVFMGYHFRAKNTTYKIPSIRSYELEDFIHARLPKSMPQNMFHMITRPY